MKNDQPKTTSTDIEEVKKEFEELMYAKGMEGVIDTKFINLALNFFAPHLSNKSELKKEIAKDIQQKVMDLIFDTRNSAEFARGFMACKTYVDGMIFQYLWSNEKEDKGDKE